MTDTILYAVVGAALLGAILGVFIDKWFTALLATVPLIVVPMGILVLLRGYIQRNPLLPESVRDQLFELAEPSILAQMAIACAGGVILSGALIRAVQGDSSGAARQKAPRRAQSVKKRASSLAERTPLQTRTDRVAATPRPEPQIKAPDVYEVEPLHGTINVSSVADKVRDTEAGGNRRRRERRRAILGGYLMFDDGRSSPCRIIDVSDSGARVRLPSILPLPERFWLLNTSDWLAHEVKLAWRSDAQAGVQFLSKRNLREPVTDRDRALHALCAELTAR